MRSPSSEAVRHAHDARWIEWRESVRVSERGRRGRCVEMRARAIEWQSEVRSSTSLRLGKKTKGRSLPLSHFPHAPLPLHASDHAPQRTRGLALPRRPRRQEHGDDSERIPPCGPARPQARGSSEREEQEEPLRRRLPPLPPLPLLRLPPASRGSSPRTSGGSPRPARTSW